MKEFRANPGSAEFWKFVASESTPAIKRNAIRDIMSSFPDRKFILIGDSGEHDPEIYGWAAGAYPDQVQEIYIRNVTDEAFGNRRMKNAFGSSIDKVGLIDMTDGSIQKSSENQYLP